jgi:O-antigen/teichoic acid export membrane protein
LLGYSAYVVQVVSIASLALIPAFFNTACRSVFLALRQMHLSFLGLLVEVTIVMSASFYLLLSNFGAAALMVTLVIAKFTSASIALVLLYCRALPLQWSLDVGGLVRTAKTVIAFGIGNMLGMLTMRINMIIVSAWVDIATVGRFAAATKILEIGLMIPALFVQLLMSRIAQSFNTRGNINPNRFGPWYQLLFALVAPVSVGVWVFAGPILGTLFGAGFDDALWVLRILMIYLAMESVDAVMSIILKAAHRQREDVNRLVFNPVTNIVLSLALLPALGMIGAAVGRVGGASASAILRHLLIARELNAVNWLRFASKPALISIVVGLVCHWSLEVHHPAWSLLLYTAATAILLAISGGFPVTAIKDMMSSRSGDD